MGGWALNRKEYMKILQFNSSGIQDPQVTGQKALKLCPCKVMVL